MSTTVAVERPATTPLEYPAGSATPHADLEARAFANPRVTAPTTYPEHARNRWKHTMTTTIARPRSTTSSLSPPVATTSDIAKRPSLMSRILHIFLPATDDYHTEHVRAAERATSLRVLTIR